MNMEENLRSLMRVLMPTWRWRDDLKRHNWFDLVYLLAEEKRYQAHESYQRVLGRDPVMARALVVAGVMWSGAGPQQRSMWAVEIAKLYRRD